MFYVNVFLLGTSGAHALSHIYIYTIIYIHIYVCIICITVYYIVFCYVLYYIISLVRESISRHL
jgi:hypothetical protein